MSDLASTTPLALDPEFRAPRRVRHQPRRRQLTVQRVQKIAAHMIRISLTGDLEGFTSLGFDDHVKLFFPPSDRHVDDETEMLSRDYTPRRYDSVANTLDIEFALHDAGPATRWAEQAQPGQSLRIGGPRGSFVVPTEFDWHLLVGDDTALPAIARRLEELPAGTRAVVLAEVDGPDDRVLLESAADVTTTWAYRKGDMPGTSHVLSKALAEANLPRGDYYAWVACESLMAKELRAQLIARHGANPKWMRAAGYWRRGAVAVHEMHND
jgi:NADPH-dependent ferric siderophore reductase